MMYNGKGGASPSIRDLRIKAARLTGNDYYKTMHQLDALAGNGALSDGEMQDALAPIAARLSGGAPHGLAPAYYAQGQPSGPDIPPPPDSPAQPDLVPTPDIPPTPDSPAQPEIDPGPDIPPVPDSPAQPDAPPPEVPSGPSMAANEPVTAHNGLPPDDIPGKAGLTSVFSAMQPSLNGFDQLAEASWRRVEEVSAGYTPSRPSIPEPAPLQALTESAISPEAANDGELERRRSDNALFSTFAADDAVPSAIQAEPPLAAVAAAPSEAQGEAAVSAEAPLMTAAAAAVTAPPLAGADLGHEAEAPDAALNRETEQALAEAEKIVVEVTTAPELPHAEREPTEPADPEERFPQTVAAHDASREKATRRGLFGRLFGGRTS